MTDINKNLIKALELYHAMLILSAKISDEERILLQNSFRQIEPSVEGVEFKEVQLS